MNFQSRSTLRVFHIINFFILAALLLSACSGFVIQGQTQDGDQPSGITITGDGPILGDQPDQSGGPILGENAIQVLLILIAFGVFILILLMAVGRASAN